MTEDVVPQGRYHVVCRDCPTETLTERALVAAERAEAHLATTGHRVVVGLVE